MRPAGSYTKRRGFRASPCRRGGFTVVELLVVITIIAVLLGLLFPALNMARRRAWDAGCLSNCSQLVRGWLSYASEHGHFPHAELIPESNGSVNHGQQTRVWAGVDWYGDEGRSEADGRSFTHACFVRERPLNEYLSLDPHMTTGDGGATRCPSDTQLMAKADPNDFYSENPAVVPFSQSPDSNTFRLSRSPDAPETAHSLHGISYIANEWIWVSASAPWGFKVTVPEQADMWLSYRNGPEDIQQASRFVMFGDMGVMNVLRNQTYGEGVNALLGQAHQFRHGPEHSSMAFLDGSARIERMAIGDGSGAESSPTYNFHPDPQRIPRLEAAFEGYNFNGRGFSQTLPASILNQYGLGTLTGRRFGAGGSFPARRRRGGDPLTPALSPSAKGRGRGG